MPDALPVTITSNLPRLETSPEYGGVHNPGLGYYGKYC